jgi:hypothetical protein
MLEAQKRRASGLQALVLLRNLYSFGLRQDYFQGNKCCAPVSDTS